MRHFKKIKDDSVNLIGLSAEMLFAWGVVAGVYAKRQNSANCVVTSGNDGTHMSNSKHYIGDALDFRVWGFTDATRALAAEEIQYILGRDYDVVDEHDHIHVEFDPERKQNVD